MTGWRDACLIAAFAAGFPTIGGETPALADDPALKRQGQVCGGDEIARGIVGKILDGRTFVLDDAREVRLAAIEVPSPAGDRAEHPAGRAAAEALGALAARDQVVRRAESGSDRCGRMLAYAYTCGTGMSSCCSGNSWSRDSPGSAAVLQIPAPAISWALRKRPARPNLAFGPIRIMRCSTPRARRMHWRSEADLRWSRAKWPPCTKTDPRSM